MNGRSQAPFHFGGQVGGANRELFGWFHAPLKPSLKNDAARDLGIVLCNPIGDDAVRAHRALRRLAERLSLAGYPVLRFDFHGSGDSSGDDGDPDRVDTWLEDIDLAIEALILRSGVSRIGLVGLRLGATLAAIAACRRDDVNHLILWNPYLSGPAFSADSIRQHKLHTMMDPAGFAMRAPPGMIDGEEALGFLITRSTLADLGKLDLMKIEKRPASRILVIGQNKGPAADSLIERLRGLGAEVELKRLNHKFLTMTPHQSTLPTLEMEAISRWFEEQPISPASDPRVAREATRTRAAELSANASAEELVFFGDDHSRFGILHLGAGVGSFEEKPPIVMINAGTVHRIGPHRLYVRMAREWANLGFNVLRIDLSGIGDTPAESGTVENICYPPRNLSDVKSAMSFLEERLSVHRFILAGLCSGADIAFQVASHDPRVVGAVMMNPRTFCVHDLEAVERLEQTRQVEASLNQKEKWIKLIKGQVNVGWHLRNFAPNMVGLARRKFGSFLERRMKATGSDADPVPSRLRLMAERGVNTLLVTSEHDPGTEYVDVHYPREMKALESVGGFRRVTFKGTDHTFTSLYAQMRVLETVTAHFLARTKQSS